MKEKKTQDRLKCTKQFRTQFYSNKKVINNNQNINNYKNVSNSSNMVSNSSIIITTLKVSNKINKIRTTLTTTTIIAFILVSEKSIETYNLQWINLSRKFLFICKVLKTGSWSRAAPSSTKMDPFVPTSTLKTGKQNRPLMTSHFCSFIMFSETCANDYLRITTTCL